MSKNELNEKLKKIEAVTVKLINKLPRHDVDYTVQVSINSTRPRHIDWAVQITPPAEGLAPITFIKDTAEELIETIKLSTKTINYKEVEKAWHNAQILSCNRTIKYHEERILDLEKEEEDDNGEDSEETATTEKVEE